MKKNIIILFLSILSIPIISAQKLKGNKNVTVEQREVPAYNAIAVRDKINVIFTASEVPDVRVETDENLQSTVEVRVNNEMVLEVFLVQEISRKKALNIFIGVPESILQIEAQDKVKIKTEGSINAKSLSITAKDYADLELNLNCDELFVAAQDKTNTKIIAKNTKNIQLTLNDKSFVKAQINTAKIDASVQDYASLNLEGKCEEFVLQTDGNTNIKAKSLESDYADIKALDRPNIYVNVSKEIIISVEDMTEIYLYNEPKIFIDKFTGKSSLYKK